jgi:hypothetical protein
MDEVTEFRVLTPKGFTKCQWTQAHRNTDAVAWILHNDNLTGILVCGPCEAEAANLNYDTEFDIRSTQVIDCVDCGQPYRLDVGHQCERFVTPVRIPWYEECANRSPLGRVHCIRGRGHIGIHSNSRLSRYATVVWE